MKYILCSNLECACPLPEGQDFCDNCNAPSPVFLSGAPLSSEGSLLGHTEGGCELRVPLTFPSYAFYGITGSRKTSLSRKLAVDAENSGIKLLVLDPEGEWKHIIPNLKGKTDYFATTRNLKINPFNLGDKQLIRILLKETVLKGVQTEFWDLSPQMNYVLDMCIEKSNSIPELIDNVSYFRTDELPFNLVGLEKTKTALLVRLLPYKNNEMLREIFYCDKSSVNLGRLDDRNIIFDLHDLDSKVAYGNEVRLIYNVITIAALRQALERDVGNRIEHMLIADEAQMLVPKILQKLLVTDTWASTTYATRGRKRNQAILFCSQSLANLEDDIRKNITANFIFKLQSPDDLQLAAALLGYTHYARVDHIAQTIGNLLPGQVIVKTSSGRRPVLINSVDARFERIPDNELATHMPHAGFSQTDAEFVDDAKQPFIPAVERLVSALQKLRKDIDSLSGDNKQNPDKKLNSAEKLFLHSIETQPFISVRERRHTLGWENNEYTSVVDRLAGKGIIKEMHVPKGRGRPLVLYQIAGKNPSVKHEYYVNWIMEHLSRKGISCQASKVGPDIQVSSFGIAINVELGGSEILGNIEKALVQSDRLIVCSDSHEVLEGVRSRIRPEQAGRTFVCFVWDVLELFENDAGLC